MSPCFPSPVIRPHHVAWGCRGAASARLASRLGQSAIAAHPPPRPMRDSRAAPPPCLRDLLHRSARLQPQRRVRWCPADTEATLPSLPLIQTQESGPQPLLPLTQECQAPTYSPLRTSGTGHPIIPRKVRSKLLSPNGQQQTGGPFVPPPPLSPN